MSEKEQRENAEQKKPGPQASPDAGPQEDLAKALAEHQAAASDEPAFDWMAGGTPATSKDASETVAKSVGQQQSEPRQAEQNQTKQNQAQRNQTERGADPQLKPTTEASGKPLAKPESANQSEKLDSSTTHQAQPLTQPEVSTRTTMLAVRPPAEEVDRRVSEREQAAQSRPVWPGIWQVLIAIFFPIVLLALAIRAIASPVFLWIEYNRPGFPADSFGFTSDDRTTFGSYAVDYLNNFAGSRFLGDLVGGQGAKLFQDSEVSHMADVKGVYQISMLIGLLLLVLMVVGMFYLSRRSVGGNRRALFAGSIATVVIIIGIGVFALLGWDRFFTDFHQLFFANGTWTFRLSDTLIRLFPEQFWTDSAASIGVLVLLVSILTLIFSWPTKRRRQLAAKAQKPSQGRRAAV
ncbi:TIGR01906 family membrane protein [Psychromicrobium lacuslunae]|uniref:TIGR01906 family membrane protein n=1 Tax=Psychromicrobium lacuslunae TaxID=1618207 RepID=UPI00069772C0|nr:TIGR01906 family membrane protein [Psychromicrobium lacuslunae]